MLAQNIAYPCIARSVAIVPDGGGQRNMRQANK